MKQMCISSNKIVNKALHYSAMIIQISCFADNRPAGSSFLLEAPVDGSFCVFLIRWMEVCNQGTLRPFVTNREYYVVIDLPLFILKEKNTILSN